MIELTGIIATALIFISFTFTDIKKIRLLNLIGSVLFIVYGLGIGATWTWVLNAGLVIVQLYFLNKLGKQKDV